MKRKLSEEEYQLYCDCNDPWCFMYYTFDYSLNKDGSYVGFDFTVDAKGYHGRFFERVKRAWKYIFWNDIESSVGGWVVDKDALIGFRDFLSRCLDKIDEKEKARK